LNSSNSIEGKYSRASDVWSFGILFWEIMTGGVLPYFDIPTNREVIQEVVKGGYRLPKPDNCPDEIYGLESCVVASNIFSDHDVLLVIFYKRKTIFQFLVF
jgi:serine/threonine protein kinase